MKIFNFSYSQTIQIIYQPTCTLGNPILPLLEKQPLTHESLDPSTHPHTTGTVWDGMVRDTSGDHLNAIQLRSKLQ